MARPIRKGISPQQSFFNADTVVIAIPEFTVTYNYIVNPVARVDCFEQHTIVDMFEFAVGNRYIVSSPPDPDTGRIDVFLEPEFL
jgi:hypothetical protein